MNETIKSELASTCGRLLTLNCVRTDDRLMSEVRL